MAEAVSVSLVQYDMILCNHHRGCAAFFQASPIGCCYSAETRRQAREEGWVVNVKDGWARSSAYRRPRLDFCPKHHP